MMTSFHLLNHVTANPFRPFQIRMTSSEVLEIPYPEMVQVGRTRATIVTGMAEANPKERQRDISIGLIELIEPLAWIASQEAP